VLSEIHLDVGWVPRVGGRALEGAPLGEFQGSILTRNRAVAGLYYVGKSVGQQLEAVS